MELGAEKRSQTGGLSRVMSRSQDIRNTADIFSRQELATILDSMQDTFYRTDIEGVLVYMSRSVKHLLGYEPAELIGTNLSDLYVEPTGRENFISAFQASNGNIEGYEAALYHKDGHIVWVSTNAHYYRDTNGEVLGLEGLTRDLTQSILQTQELNRLKSTLDKTLDCVFMFEPDTLKFFYLNEGAIKQVGYSSKELLQMTPVDIKPDYNEAQFRALIQPLLDGRKDSLTFETVHRHKDGHNLPVEIFLQYVKPTNETPRFVAIVRDLSERIEAQERLRHLAHHDSLTNLPNRLLFMDRLEHALARRQNGGEIAVLFMDLDRFKVINDTLGHASGDKVLQLLGERISGCVRKGDTLARISGDEFAIILEDTVSTEAVVSVARHILDELTKPFVVENHDLFVTTSIGISMSPDDGEDSQTLLKHADIAMYRAKDLGRNTYRFYSPDMSSKAFERLNLEISLRYALEREQFRLFYQPQYDVITGKVIGVEALLRWQHPDLGLVAPNDFISTLEETGLIVPVGEWVLYTACMQAREWQKKYDKKLRMSVNLSAHQFNDVELSSMVEYCLQRSQLPASTLELEITESVIMQDKKRIGRTFQTLEDLGVRFAIDDFGTGYSSLSYLKRFPIDTIKIDRSFVRDVCSDSDDAAIVSAIIAIAKSLNMEVVAEGVETESQLDFIKRQDCFVMQGFLFGEPVMAEKIDILLADTFSTRSDKGYRQIK
jgi:diguanylate cyclase (GGDEF)-like protein/PAS domain S-box-containing protein